MIKHYSFYVFLLFISLFSPMNVLLFGEVTEPNTQKKTEEEIPLPPSLRGHDVKQLPRDDNFMKEFINMLMTLGAIIALLLVVSFALKRVANTRMQQMNESSVIKILERRTVTPKTAIYLVEVKGKEFAIAESSSGIILLPDIPDDLS